MGAIIAAPPRAPSYNVANGTGWITTTGAGSYVATQSGMHRFDLIGGGSGGQPGNGSHGGQGGPGGASATFQYWLTAGDTVNYSVAGTAASNTQGNATTVTMPDGTILRAPGGGGINVADTQPLYANPGALFSGGNCPGTFPYEAGSGGGGSAGFGGNGGDGAAPTGNSSPGAGGSAGSDGGAAGGNGGTSANGAAGSTPGGGGGGGGKSNSGGVGAGGAIRITPST